MKKSLIYLGVAIGVFTLIACAMLANFNAMFVVAYLFCVLALATGWYTLRLTFKKGKDAKSQFYGFPILRIGAIYVVIQFAASILSMIFAKHLPVGIMLPAFFVLFCFAAGGLLATSATRDEIDRQDQVLKKKVSKMRELQSMSRTMLQNCEDAELKKELEKLADALRYSDPVSSDALATTESNLSACMQELQASIIDGDISSALQLCKRAQQTLIERNRLCKLNKN